MTIYLILRIASYQTDSIDRRGMFLNPQGLLNLINMFGSESLKVNQEGRTNFKYNKHIIK